MMGTDEDPGVIPRLCEGLYARINANHEPSISYRVEVSYVAGHSHLITCQTFPVVCIMCGL